MWKSLICCKPSLSFYNVSKGDVSGTVVDAALKFRCFRNYLSAEPSLRQPTSKHTRLRTKQEASNRIRVARFNIFRPFYHYALRLLPFCRRRPIISLLVSRGVLSPTLVLVHEFLRPIKIKDNDQSNKND